MSTSTRRTPLWKNSATRSVQRPRGRSSDSISPRTLTISIRDSAVLFSFNVSILVRWRCEVRPCWFEPEGCRAHL